MAVTMTAPATREATLRVVRSINKRFLYYEVSIMNPFFESLESRRLFSVTPLSPVAPSAPREVIVQPLIAKKMTGKWKGMVVVTNIQTQPVTVTIKQKSNGKFTGMLTAVNDPTIQVAVSGKISSNGKVRITLKGIHSGGVIDGSGTGKLHGKSITFTLVFQQNGVSFPGSLTLKKA